MRRKIVAHLDWLFAFRSRAQFALTKLNMKRSPHSRFHEHSFLIFNEHSAQAHKVKNYYCTTESTSV